MRGTLRLLAIGALVLAPLTSIAASAPDIADPAIKAYEAQRQANELAASDRLIANRAAALLNDPATPVMGNPNGDVAIIEFFDYTCPYCKALEPRLEQLLKDDKNVKLVLKQFPILTPESVVASKVALAAAKQGKFAAFHLAMINFKGRLTEEAIFDTAKDAGLDIARLKKDMFAPEIADQIIATFNLARAVRIFQTPGFIAGGHMLTGNSSDWDFPKIVAQARGK